mmetsp:Transcript_23911/g.60471  ORF Transcript_23911/g.60471 Transcript_23911/m.60471 type:complete len:615 (-) Transcript_23911:545-2389(-)
MVGARLSHASRWQSLPLALFLALFILASLPSAVQAGQSATLVAKPGNRERVLRNFLQPEVPHSTYKGKETTLVTQFTVNRAAAFEKLVESWRGPISASIYIQDAKSDTREIVGMWDRSAAVRKYALIHLVISKTGPYPVNMLRNVALDEAVTEYIFPIDVDFVVSPSLRDRLKEDDVAKMLKEKGAVIIPAFELSSPTLERPTTKKQLAEMARSGKAFQVHRYFPAGHVMIDYDRYLSATKSYVAKYTEDSEPYYLTKRPFPRYDERFKGRGGNKQSQVYEMTVAGFKFYVLHDAHLIHYCVKRKSEDLIGNQNKNKDVLQSFKFDIMLKYKTDKNFLATRSAPRHVDDPLVQVCKIGAKGQKKGLHECVLRTLLFDEDLPPHLLINGESDKEGEDKKDESTASPSTSPPVVTCDDEVKQIGNLRKEMDELTLKLKEAEDKLAAPSPSTSTSTSAPRPTSSPSTSHSSGKEEGNEEEENEVEEGGNKNSSGGGGKEEEEDTEEGQSSPTSPTSRKGGEGDSAVALLQKLFDSPTHNVKSMCPKVHSAAQQVILQLMTKVEDKEKMVLQVQESALLYKYLFLGSTALTVGVFAFVAVWVVSKRSGAGGGRSHSSR